MHGGSVRSVISKRSRRSGPNPAPSRDHFPGIDGADLQQRGPVFGLRSGPGRVSRSRDRMSGSAKPAIQGRQCSRRRRDGCRWEPMTVPAALLSHASTEHYTPQYILDAVIACMEAIDLDPCSNSTGDPECAGSEALHSSGQWSPAAVDWEGISQSSVRL